MGVKRSKFKVTVELFIIEFPVLQYAIVRWTYSEWKKSPGGFLTFSQTVGDF